MHIAPPWNPNWSPSHHVNDAAPMTNSSLCWPPEPSIDSIEAPRLPPQNHQGLEFVTHESSGGPHPWRFWVKGIKPKNYLKYPPPPPPVSPLHPSPTSPILSLLFFFFCLFFFFFFVTTANTPSYRRQNNRHVDCGPLNERRRVPPGPPQWKPLTREDTGHEYKKKNSVWRINKCVFIGGGVVGGGEIFLLFFFLFF